MPRHRSHGDGRFEPSQFRAIGPDCVFEPGVLVFHPESITLGANVYVGHYAILKGYYKNAMVIGDETWIGQQCFLHAAGGITIGARVGIGPGVRVITAGAPPAAGPPGGVNGARTDATRGVKRANGPGVTDRQRSPDSLRRGP